MSTVTYLACDHCGIEDTTAGVGKDNIDSVSLEIDLPLVEKTRQFMSGHLCISCQQEISKFLKKYGLWQVPRLLRGVSEEKIIETIKRSQENG